QDCPTTWDRSSGSPLRIDSTGLQGADQPVRLLGRADGEAQAPDLLAFDRLYGTGEDRLGAHTRLLRSGEHGRQIRAGQGHLDQPGVLIVDADRGQGDEVADRKSVV